MVDVLWMLGRKGGGERSTDLAFTFVFISGNCIRACALLVPWVEGKLFGAHSRQFASPKMQWVGHHHGITTLECSEVVM